MDRLLKTKNRWCYYEAVSRNIVDLLLGGWTYETTETSEN